MVDRSARQADRGYKRLNFLHIYLAMQNYRYRLFTGVYGGPGYGPALE